MNKHLVQLIELAQIDSDIDSFLPREEAINENLNKIFEQQKKNMSQIAELEDVITENKMKKSKSEAHLAELSAKLDSFSKKSSMIKNEKEMKSLQLEEEIAKEQISYANEEIDRYDRVEKAKEAEIKILKEENEKLSQKAQEAEKNTEVEIKNLEIEKKTAYVKKEKLVGEVPQKVLSFYQKIRRWAGNTAVVPVRQQACYGCFIKINDKIYADVIRSEEIVMCPNCGRILYMPDEE